MSLRKIWFQVATVAMLAAPNLRAAEVLTLDAALDAAARNNRAVAIAKLGQQKSSLEVNVARTRRWPVFSANVLASQSVVRSGLTLERGILGDYANVGPIPGRTTTLNVPRRPSAIIYATAALPLSQQYRIGLGIEMAKVGESAAAQNAQVQELDAAVQVRTLYLSILQLHSRRRSLESTRTFLERLQIEVANNVAQKTALTADLSLVKAQIAEVELGLVKLRDPIESQRAELNRLMSRDPDDAWEPVEVVPEDPAAAELPELQAKARAQRPELQLAALQTKKAGLDARMKNAERIPDLNLSYTSLTTANLSSTLPSGLGFAGFQLTWDGFDWGRKRTEVKVKRLALRQAELEQADVAARIQTEVGHRHRRVAEAKSEVRTAAAVRQAAEDALRVTTDRYRQKEVLLSDVLKARAAVTDAEARGAIAQLSLATAQAELKRALGE